MENSIVLYSLNGLYFSDLDIFISDSEGLLDFPKIRENLGYTWDEYDGIQISKSKKPRFEPKEISLKGWVEGKDLDDMNFKFKKILSEFKKSYTQRLVVEAFDQNPLVFDVILRGNVKLSKVFRKGEMVGFFELNMLEPNPIKRTFKLIGNTLQMSTDSEKWIDVNIDGQSVSAKGPSNFNQNLNRRSLSPFPYLGRNLMVENNVELNKQGIYQIDLPKISKYLDLGSVLYTNFDLKSQNPETVKANISGRFLSLTNQFNSNVGYQNFSGNLKIVKEMEPAEWAPSISDPGYPSFHSDTNYLTFTGTNYFLKNIFVGKALPGQKWEIAPENVHYINIYGDLSNITTNAIEI